MKINYLISLLVLLVAPLARIQACPILPVVEEHADLAQWYNTRRVLADQLTHCLDNADFFALYGASLLKTDALDQAIEMLERALLLMPDHGAALVDYADAMRQAGRVHTAMELNQKLLHRTDLPDPLRALLQQRIEQLQTQTIVWSKRMMFAAGFDNNLNMATSADTLELTIDARRIQVALDQASTAQAGRFANIQFDISRTSQHLNYQSRTYAVLESRMSTQPRADIDQLRLGYERRYETLVGQARWQWENRYFVYGNDEQFLLSDASVRHQWHASTCAPYVAVHAKALFMLNYSQNNDVALHLMPGVRCDLPIGLLDLAVDGMYNHARGMRAGGDRTGYDIALSLQRPWQSGVLWASAGYGVTQDAEGYSALFDANRIRKTTNHSAAIQYVMPLAAQTQLHFGLNYQQQRSNLALFNTHSAYFSVGISALF